MLTSAPDAFHFTKLQSNDVATDQHVLLKMLQNCRLIRHTREMSMPFRAKTLLTGSFTARRLLGSLSGAAAAASAAAACTRRDTAVGNATAAAATPRPRLRAPRPCRCRLVKRVAASVGMAYIAEGCMPGSIADWQAAAAAAAAAAAIGTANRAAAAPVAAATAASAAAKACAACCTIGAAATAAAVAGAATGPADPAAAGMLTGCAAAPAGGDCTRLADDRPAMGMADSACCASLRCAVRRRSVTPGVRSMFACTDAAMAPSCPLHHLALHH